MCVTSDFSNRRKNLTQKKTYQMLVISQIKLSFCPAFALLIKLKKYFKFLRLFGAFQEEHE
jgi:hypothetical protein